MSNNNINFFMSVTIIPLLELLLLSLSGCYAVEQAAVGELFTYKIEPQLFNWTHAVIGEQFRYRPSLLGYPDLPSWMRYKISHEYHAGFLYGTPPENLAGKTFHLDIVALNKKNYETRKVILSIHVAHKFPTPNVIQMKIDNLNWVHLMDPGRVENLRNIFRKNLWIESENDLNLIFMESAVNMGGRLPLKPQQREGVVVHLGSFAQFSARLKELQEEIRPLYKLSTCTYKRTSVQKIFENAGFKLDWCAFKMVGVEISPEILFHNHGNHGKSYPTSSEAGNLKRNDRWQGMSRDDVPNRNYIDEFAFALAIPGMIFAVLVAILTTVLCFEYDKYPDPYGEYFFENVFHICEESCVQQTQDSEAENESDNSAAYEPTSSMLHCADGLSNQPMTTLKSLKDPKDCLLDNTSLQSQSPSNSYFESPTNSYLRPKPPPYNGNLSKNPGVDI